MGRFLIIGLNHLIEWYLGYRYMSGVYRSGFKKKRLLILLGAANMLLLISFSDNVAINILVNFVVVFAAVLLSTGKRPVSVAFNVFLFEFMIITAENLALFAVRTSGITVSTDEMSYEQLFILTLIDKFIFIILVELLLLIRRRELADDRRYGLANYLIIAVSVISVLELLCFLVVMTGDGIDHNEARVLTLSTVLVLLLNVMIYVLNAVIARENRRKNQLAMDAQREKDLDNYIRLLEQKISDERIFIHDVKHHFSALQEMLKKNETEAAGRYLEEITGDRSLHSGFKYTGNSILNLLLARYDSACREKHIELYIDAQNSYLDFLDYADITSLICNLMDNAIDAAGQADHPFIQLKIDHIKARNTSVISVNNTCAEKPKRGRDGSLITSKSDGSLHGTGQRSIQKVVDRYGGTFSNRYDQETGEFITDITLRDYKAGSAAL